MQIRNSASTLTTEFLSILSCITFISQITVKQKYTIHSHLPISFRPYSFHPIIQRIQLIVASLTSVNIAITLLWIPAHIGLREHDIMDQAATQALALPTVTNRHPTTASDLRIYYRHYQMPLVQFKKKSKSK